MTMKKRMTMLVLAGLLAATLVACNKQQERPDTPPAGDDSTTTTATSTPDVPDVPGVQWTDVDEVVYVTAAQMTLTNVDNASETLVVKAMESFKRIKIGSNEQSIVVKENKQYYAPSKNLSADDLKGEGFSNAEAGKTLYAKDSVNVRTYASSDSSFSAVKKTLSRGEEVKLVADGGSWYKIEYKTSSGTDTGFVFAKYMVTTLDKTEYTVTDMTPTEQYVIVEKVNLREEPLTDATILEVYSKETAVTVVGSTMVEGKLWYKVWVAVTPEAGQSPDSLEGFISADCLSTNKGDTSARTLEDMLAEYTSYTQLNPAQTLYATGNLNVRSTPKVTVEGEKSNLIATLIKTNAVKVVALSGDEKWAMIEYKEGEYYFVSYPYLTNDPEGGEMIPSLAHLLAMHSEFSACEEKTVYAKSGVNCYTAPSISGEVTKQLGAGDAVTVVAEGTVRLNNWYIFKTSDGKFFFAGASMFTDTAPTA